MKRVILLIVLTPTLLWSQETFTATYIYESYGDYDMEATLSFDGTKLWYSRHQNPREIVSEEGYEYYHYRDYLDWYMDLASNNIYVTRDKHNYPVLYSKFKSNDTEWQITDEMGEIAGFQVQKAIGKPHYNDSEFFKYGEVIAWFTTEVPVNAGPEGYYGLPGLIIKLEYSGMGIFVSTLKSIDFGLVNDIQKPSPTGKVLVNNGEIYNLATINKKWLKKQKKLLESGK